MRRIVCIILVLSIALTQMMPAGYSGPPSAVIPIASKNLQQDLTAISLSSDLGTIQETHHGDTGKTVVLIQDAHSVPDAQQSIQAVIDFFQTEYGVSLVGLEGASAPLDAQIFKSFPDRERLKKVFAEFSSQGELTGVTAAAVFNRRPSVYHGVEDWSLYEQGVAQFLAAVKIERDTSSALQDLFRNLDTEKAKIYSPALLKVDRDMTNFKNNQTDLIQVLKQLSTYLPPPPESELALLLEEAKGDRIHAAPVEGELRKSSAKVRTFLLAQPQTDEIRQDLGRLNEKFQEFQTSAVTPQSFGLFLKSLVVKYRIKTKVSRDLASLVRSQKKLENIKGTRIFNELERYEAAVKEFLFENTRQRTLEAQTQNLTLIKRLASLELSFDDWERIQEMIPVFEARTITRDNVAGREAISVLVEKMRPNLEFYRIAESRDEILLKNMTRLMKTRQASSAMLIAGGFHAEGLIKKFRKQGISYVLVMPKIKTIPAGSFYREHMSGKVSWSRYFEVENGKINLYQAFVRGARDKLLASDPARREMFLKSWRDQIIRDLAAEGKIASAPKYTKFIDEISEDSAALKQLRQDWVENIDRFGKGLRRLQEQGKFNQENILRLIESATTAEPVLANALAADAWSEATLFSSPEVLRSKDRKEIQKEIVKPAQVAVLKPPTMETPPLQNLRTSVPAQARSEGRSAADESAKLKFKKGINLAVAFLPAVLGSIMFTILKPFLVPAVTLQALYLSVFSVGFLLLVAVRARQSGNWQKFQWPKREYLITDTVVTASLVALGLNSYAVAFQALVGAGAILLAGLAAKVWTKIQQRKSEESFSKIRHYPFQIDLHGRQILIATLLLVLLDWSFKYGAFFMGTSVFNWGGTMSVLSLAGFQVVWLAIIVFAFFYRVPLGVVIAYSGFIANFYDKYFMKGVIDFIPATVANPNLADWYIAVGTGIFILDVVFATLQSKTLKDYFLTRRSRSKTAVATSGMQRHGFTELLLIMTMLAVPYLGAKYWHLAQKPGGARTIIVADMMSPKTLSAKNLADLCAKHDAYAAENAGLSLAGADEEFENLWVEYLSQPELAQAFLKEINPHSKAARFFADQLESVMEIQKFVDDGDLYHVWYYAFHDNNSHPTVRKVVSILLKKRWERIGPQADLERLAAESLSADYDERYAEWMKEDDQSLQGIPIRNRLDLVWAATRNRVEFLQLFNNILGEFRMANSTPPVARSENRGTFSEEEQLIHVSIHSSENPDAAPGVKALREALTEKGLLHRGGIVLTDLRRSEIIPQVRRQLEAFSAQKKIRLMMEGAYLDDCCRQATTAILDFAREHPETIFEIHYPADLIAYPHDYLGESSAEEKIGTLRMHLEMDAGRLPFGIYVDGAAMPDMFSEEAARHESARVRFYLWTSSRAAAGQINEGGLAGKTEARSEVRLENIQIAAAALAPKNSGVALAIVQTQNIAAASSAVFTMVEAEGVDRVREMLIRAMERLIRLKKGQAEFQTEGDLENQSLNLEVLKKQLDQAFRLLAAKAGQRKVYIALDAPAGSLNELKENLPEALGIFGDGIENIVWTASGGQKVEIPAAMRDILKKFGMRVPVIDPVLRQADHLMTANGQEILGIAGLGSSQNMEALIKNFKGRAKLIRHVGDFDGLNVIDKKALLLLDVFLALAVALDREISDAAFLAYGFKENQITLDRNGNINISVDLLASEMRATRAVKTAA